ncbi:hypothetical protein F0Z19_2053 [Vibrio cyclitrophicus]|nr:hypothetical protein F0Z19_2053 [Vibrio cyclitrophicus]
MKNVKVYYYTSRLYPGSGIFVATMLSNIKFEENTTKLHRLG